mgnify:CR=1 FL=1
MSDLQLYFFNGKEDKPFDISITINGRVFNSSKQLQRC